MKSMSSFFVMSICVLFMSLFAVGCSHKGIKSESEAPMSREARAIINNPSLKMVHFEFNKSVLTNKAKAILDQDASALKQVASLRFQIQGFCDDRGGTDYNLALGKKRAEAVQKYLVSMGIESSRISVVSFGKADPIDARKTEAAYALNRRANFSMQTFTASVDR